MKGARAGSVFADGFCAPHQRRFILIAAILASAMGFIDSTVVSIAIPAIRDTTGASLTQAQWVHNAYMLTLSALILVGGAAGDRFGLARVFGLGIALFVAASVFCAVAPDPTTLIAARTLQGGGAAIMVPGSLAIISRAYPRAERGRAIGIWAGASALTTSLGPLVGGLALSIGAPEMWRWIFAVNLPLGAVALWLLVRTTRRDVAQIGTQLDLAGAVLATFALFCLAWGLTVGQGQEADLRWIGAGVLALVAFVRVEARHPQPMMPLHLFRSPVFSAANAMSFSLYGAVGMMFFFMPMTFVAGWGAEEIEIAGLFAPMGIFIPLLSPWAGRQAERIGPAPLLVAGCLITGSGYAAMALLAPAEQLWTHMLPAMCAVGIGLALLVAPLSTAVMAAAPEESSGIASGINNAVSRMAGLMSVAAVGGLVASAYADAGGPAGFGVASNAPGHGAAMNAAFAKLAWWAAGACALSAVLSLLIWRAR